MSGPSRRTSYLPGNGGRLAFFAVDPGSFSGVESFRAWRANGVARKLSRCFHSSNLKLAKIIQKDVCGNFRHF